MLVSTFKLDLERKVEILAVFSPEELEMLLEKEDQKDEVKEILQDDVLGGELLTNRASNQEAKKAAPKKNKANYSGPSNDIQQEEKKAIPTEWKHKSNITVEQEDQEGGGEEESGDDVVEQFTEVSNISFKLSGRTSNSKPNPVYLCETGGKIVVDIWVDNNGNVVKVKANPEKSAVQNTCLFRAAEKHARKFVFNKAAASEKQQGTVTINFQKQ